jgi:hypothetical protein
MNTNNYIKLYCDNYKDCKCITCVCNNGNPWIAHKDSVHKDIVNKYNLLEGGKFMCNSETNKETTFSTSPFLVIMKRKLNGK